MGAARLYALLSAVSLLGASYYLYLPLPDSVAEPHKLMVLDAVFRTAQHVGTLTERLGLCDQVTFLQTIISRVARVPAHSDAAVFVRDAELETFLEKVMGASNYGVSVLNNASGRVNWDFTSALFFASTVLTTTGYGHTVPLSDGGKAFCIIYSVVGIPFTLLLLTAVVQRLMALVTRRPIAYMQRRLGASRQRVATAHAVVLVVVVITCFFFIPAGIFTALETSWNFLEAFYFCFISLSTIGLGDYVPGEAYGQHLRELYKFCVTCYLIIGLVAMLLMLDTVGELSEIRYLSGIFHTGGAGGAGDDDDDDRVGIVDGEELPVSTVSDLAANGGGGGGEKSSQPLAFSGPASTYHTMGNGQ